MKRIIHVNQHIIKSNRKNKEDKPVLTCKTYKQNLYGNTVEFTGKQSQQSKQSVQHLKGMAGKLIGVFKRYYIYHNKVMNNIYNTFI